ncbi:MAG: aminoacyl-tRNA hydrolase [Treponema sp.]|nr:aminoacyl-tRNA hydrolase [Treponema sp.]
MNLALLRKSILENASASFSRASGPGGQNVNKVSTKATLRICLSDLCGLSPEELERARLTLGDRVTGAGEIVVSADETRSQLANLNGARAKLERLVIEAARLPKARKKTKPSRAARERRLEEKRESSQKKAERAFRPSRRED